MKKDLFIIAETIENRLVGSSTELIEAACRLMPSGPENMLLIIAGQNVQVLAEKIAGSYNIDVIALENENLFYPNPVLLAGKLRETVDKLEPRYICLQHNVRGCQIAAALAGTNNASCITAVESLELKDDLPVFRRAVFNGKLSMDVISKTEQTIVTVLPGAFSHQNQMKKSKRPGTAETIKIKSESVSYIPLGLSKTSENDNALEEADVIISAGRGVGGKDNLKLIQDTASIFKNAAVGASRTLCDLRWLPYARQVGETGKSVSPRLYMACGISGARQHIVGMRSSQWVVAVNSDPQAVIFSIADYGVVEDLNTFLPLLVKKYHENNN